MESRNPKRSWRGKKKAKMKREEEEEGGGGGLGREGAPSTQGVRGSEDGHRDGRTQQVLGKSSLG